MGFPLGIGVSSGSSFSTRRRRVLILILGAAEREARQRRSAPGTERTFAVDGFNVGYWNPKRTLLTTDPERFSLRSIVWPAIGAIFP